jgi:hypothetical protein
LTNAAFEARRIAEVLEIPAPEQASADELLQWVSWWRASYEAASRLSDEQRNYLKSGGWWPPLNAAQIEYAPDIVRRTQRPGLWARTEPAMTAHFP